MVCITPFRGQFGGVCTRVGSTYVWEWAPRDSEKHAKPWMGWYFFQFVDFINVDMLTVIFFKNCYEKMEYIYFK